MHMPVNLRNMDITRSFIPWVSLVLRNPTGQGGAASKDLGSKRLADN